ncbi:hypothetical protein WJX73_009569 [Symbiochloris irregularis]|uniref:Uncharacterized protein n=1 Tax=Symbiochloris irregularis TaxID=706552 RepID=A0AAW1NMB2_9CHLO
MSANKAKRLREPIDGRQKLLDLLEDWGKDQWPACVTDAEQQEQQLKLQGEAWLLQQVERWEVDLSPFRNHKLKFSGGTTVKRWQSIWTSGVDLVARYKQARLDDKLPDKDGAAEKRQELLDQLSHPTPGALLSCAERREGGLLQQLRDVETRVSKLAGKVRQCRLAELQAWQATLNTDAPENLDFRKQQTVNADIHRLDMLQTEEARQNYLAACTESKRALSRLAELRSLYSLAVVERQLLQFVDTVDYTTRWDTSHGPHKEYAGMKFRTKPHTIAHMEGFMVQKLHNDEWVDWVMVAQSTIPGAGRGIFAARDFEALEFIGRYLGKVLGLRADFTDAVLKAHDSPYILTVKTPGRHGRDIAS